MSLSITKPTPGDPTTSGTWGTTLNNALDAIVNAVNGLATVATTGAKADVGLGNVDNTSDANKPVSTAQAAADALAIPKQSLTRFGLGMTVTVGKTRGVDFCTLDYASDDLCVQAAVNSLTTGYGGGGHVYICQGQYDFVGGVTVGSTTHNVRVSGAGLSTQIRWKNGNVFATATANSNWLFTTNDYFMLDNLLLNGRSTYTCPINGVNTFSAQGTNTLGGGIQITGGRVWLHNIYITGMAEDGITNNGGIGTKYSNVEIIGCGGTGLNLTGVQNATTLNYATDNDMSSVWIGSCNVGLSNAVGGLWIAGAHVWGCQSDGIQVNADFVRISDCYPENNGGWGININSRNSCVVTGCDIWGNGLAFTGAANAFGGLQITSGKFNTICDNKFRDNRYQQLLLASSSFDNLVIGNTGIDTFAFNIGADTATTLTASGTQTLTTTFIDNNAPAWMATKQTALGHTLAITGAGASGATLNAQVVDWVSTTQVTLSVAQSTVTTNTTYGVHAMAHGARETGVATRNTFESNDFRQGYLGNITLNAVSGRNSQSRGNKGIDEMSWYEAGNVGGGTLGPDLRNGCIYHATLTANITTVSIFSGGVIPRGTRLIMLIAQDATGGRTVTGWPANVKGTTTVTTTASATTRLEFIYDGTNWY